MKRIIEDFCSENADTYVMHEGYSGRGMFSRKCVGIIVKQGSSYMEMLVKLTKYLDHRGEEDADLEFEGLGVDELGLDTIVYFPEIES